MRGAVTHHRHPPGQKEPPSRLADRSKLRLNSLSAMARPILPHVCFALLMALSPAPGFSFSSGLTDANGDSPFSPEFTRAVEAAQSAVNETKSAEPILRLLKTFTRPEEQLELNLEIGLIYNQRTDLVDPADAVYYLGKVLAYHLPERTRIAVLMWRGNSSEQLREFSPALADYLRGLLACSYHDLSGPWPEIRESGVAIYLNSPDPENNTRIRDYNQYREAIELERYLLQQKYYFVEAVKRIRDSAHFGDEVILKALGELSPDLTRREVVLRWLKAENKRSWP